MKTIAGLEWKRCGTLANPTKEQNHGTYLLVYDGQPKRVFYAGTATSLSFIDRWNQHKQALREGLFTLWRDIEPGDIYELMRSGGLRGAEMETHFKSQAQPPRPKLWGAAIDNRTRTNTGRNYFNQADLWSTEWREYAVNIFAPRISLWACVLDDVDLAKLLETQIQRALGAKFDLGYYSARTPQNWLGHQEKPGCPDLKDYRFEFKSLPDVDEESKKVLMNLPAYLP
jgi:hypothetical protein